jgi:hypothetical protein
MRWAWAAQADGGNWHRLNGVQFELRWRNKFLTPEATTLDDRARRLEEAAAELRRMQAAAVQLAPEGFSDPIAQGANPPLSGCVT